MRTTIDGGGRVVIPKAVRDRLGLHAGARVEVTESDGAVEIRPALSEIDVLERDGRLVAHAEGLPSLTDELVRETIERLRR
jgi:AbrB family looped-hinge helix DNA binding protein